jgi:transcriptional regulator with PAS, ATPase and Fis domain
MANGSWVEEIRAAVTVCDREGIVLEMNDEAVRVFEPDGGRALLGTNLLDCHPEPARQKLREMLKAPELNAYTIEKNGVRKLIYQAPWYQDGRWQGIVELSLPLPADMPHFVR